MRLPKLLLLALLAALLPSIYQIKLMATPTPSPRPSTGTAGSSSRYLSDFIFVPGTDYSYRQKMNPDGTVGIDYFGKLGKPINNTEFRAATGVDTNILESGSVDIEDLVAPAQNSGDSEFSRILKSISDKQTASSSAAAAPAAPVFNPVQFNGQTFYDPASLAEAQRGYLDTQNRDSLGALDTQLERATGMRNPNAVNASSLLDANDNSIGGDIGKAKSSLLKQVMELLSQYDKQETQGLGNLSAYYGNLGDVYQSSQGVRETETRDEANKARTSARTQQTEGLSGLQRTLQDYLLQDKTSRNNLATNYRSTLDTMQNGAIGNLSESLNRGVTRQDLSVGNPTVAASNVNNNSGLLGALKKTANGAFRLDGGKTNPQSLEDIIGYLYQGA